MPQTEQNGMQQKNSAEIDSGSSKSSQNESSKFDSWMKSLKGKSISKPKLRDTVMEMLFDDATDAPQVGKWYYFEYDPKFKDQLGEWDEFPLVKLLEKKNDIYLGANLHYLNAKARLSAINTDKYPNSSLHYYIPKKADSIFFEVGEEDIQLLSQLPLDKFHRNRK